jgi:hypothetical protein
LADPCSECEASGCAGASSSENYYIIYHGK